MAISNPLSQLANLALCVATTANLPSDMDKTYSSAIHIENRIITTRTKSPESNFGTSGNAFSPKNSFLDLNIVQILQRLDMFAVFLENWDGRGSLKPSIRSIDSAKQIVISNKSIFARAEKKFHISSDESGNITFEWRSREKMLTVYFDVSGIDYVKSWGNDFDGEMQSGTSKIDEEIKDLLNWIYSDTRKNS